jgi:SAM-dependent methyltransferase
MPEARPEPSAREIFNRRLPLYSYLEPLLVGQQVLEIGCGTGGGAAQLAARGAARVVSVDTDPALVERARSRFRHPNLEFHTVSSLIDLAALGEPFDVVLVADGEGLVRRVDAVISWKGLMADDGRLIVAAASADRLTGHAGAPGIGYYELSDALGPHFPRVQMFGVTPFAAFGIVEFDGAGDEADAGLRVDSRLLDGGGEPPGAYVAVGGVDPADGLGYALVQVPAVPLEARLEAADRRAEVRVPDGERRTEEGAAERRVRTRLDEAEARISELRRKLDDATHQSESAMRVARAQGEEMEELRARLRRASEDRTALDGEVAKLRRALTEADESVMSLTRRTAEEMSAVAERLAVGLRSFPDRAPPPRHGELATRDDGAHEEREESARLRVALAEAEARASAAEQRLEEVATDGRERQGALDDAFERLRLSEDAVARERREVARLEGEVRSLAARSRALDESEDALAARDDRIARLEGDKQDLMWRLAELEEKLRDAIARAVAADGGRAPSEDLAAARVARDRAQEEFHRAAGAHVDEITQLRASVAEQAALVAELQDEVAAAEARATAATAEAAGLRKNAKSLEDADRTRRSRLAELEGKLLRLEHERKTAAAAPPVALDAASQEAAQRLVEVARQRDELFGNLERLSRAAADSQEALARATGELGLTRQRLGEAEAEAAHLRAAAEVRPAAQNGHEATVIAVTRELDAIEAGLADGLGALAGIERSLTEGAGFGNGGPSLDDGGEAILMHATLANYRRRAGRLRDELEGIRGRFDSLSPSEIEGYLEELGEDLAELEK